MVKNYLRLLLVFSEVYNFLNVLSNKNATAPTFLDPAVITLRSHNFVNGNFKI